MKFTLRQQLTQFSQILTFTPTFASGSPKLFIFLVFCFHVVACAAAGNAENPADTLESGYGVRQLVAPAFR